MLRSMRDTLLVLLVPCDCRLCGAPMVHAGPTPLCRDCLLHLATSPLSSACSVCCEPLPPDVSLQYLSADLQGMERQLCSACRAERPRFVRATAYGLYDTLRPAIRLLKFDGVRSLAIPLGDLLAEAILVHQAESPAELAVVPVPLYRGKRSFNQSSLLAARALKRVRRSAPAWSLCLRPRLLRRVRRTESQFLLSPAQRHENLRGAFRASAQARGLDILLIDDVYTTGATAVACTQALLHAGARSVRVATLARAGRDVAVIWRPQMQAVAASARDAPGRSPALFS